MADQAQFEALLESLMSTNNDVRIQSEESYDKIPSGTKIPFLVQSMKNSNAAIETRTMSAVLLRRQFSCSFEECWPMLTDEMKAMIKEQMMIAIREELTPPVRRKICDATAELARNMIDDDENVTWPEILKFLFECASHEDSGLRESALHIFTNVPGIFGNQQTHYLDVIKQMLNANLHDADHLQVRFEAVKATTAFLVANDKQQSILAHFRDLLPAILQAMIDSVNAQEDDSLLKCLIELAESVPKYLRSQLDNIIPFCLKIVSDANLDDSWRQLGMEAIVTLSETAPAMVRKFSKFMSLLVPQILALMVDLEEETDWALQDEPEEEDTESNAISAESALDRLACALGGKTTLPHILANIPQMLQNDDWRYRHAALMAISACGEGCHQQMEIMLGNVVEAILPFLKDPHPRVRYAACNAIGQISTDFGPILQKKFHEKVVPSLLMVMDDDANPRVQAHGAAALVNFSEDCPKTILVQYLDLIILKLEQVLVSKFKETETVFVENVDIADGKAVTITECLKDVIKRVGLQNRKIIGLGSDGASVMTGSKNGVGVLLRKDVNKYMVNIHCVAHRLALVTSQAAAKIEQLQKHLETLTSIYYWFKHSALRTSALSALQEVLDLPQISIKEVHAVRWFSFYNALEAVFRSWPALAMLLEQNATTEAKAKGILKAVTTSMFVGITHILMDVIPIMTHLNMIFQKENLDLSIVMPAIKGARHSLNILTSEPGHHESLFQKEVTDSTTEFKGVKLLRSTSGNIHESVRSVKMKFIENILAELERRFPDNTSALLNSFSVLAMRGIRFLSENEESAEWNEKLKSVLEWYGEGDEPYVSKDTTLIEWETAKQLVREQKYPTENTQTLWYLLQQHSDVIPNIMKLASISSALPVHTSDVERGFSAQNLAKTAHRNRLTSKVLNDILLIKIEGPTIENFDFMKALLAFKNKKDRKLYSSNLR